MEYLFILIIGIVFSFFGPKSKLLNFIITLLIVVVIIKLMGAVSAAHSFDTDAYQAMYSWAPSTHRFEQGYMFLTYFFYNRGYTYQQFRLLASLIFTVILYCGVRRFTVNTATFFSLFMIFPFFVEATQVRNFYMFAIVLLGVSFLPARHGSRIALIVGCLTIMFSSLFQVSGIIYVLVPLLMLVPSRILVIVADYLISIFSLLVVFIHYFLPTTFIAKILSIVTNLSGRSNVDSIVALYSQGSSFSWVVLYLLAFIGVYILVRVVCSTSEMKNLLSTKALFCVFAIGILVIPALAGSADFERFLRNAITASLIIFSDFVWRRNSSLVNKIKIVPVVVVVMLMTTLAWKYWNPGVNGRFQYIPYISQIYKD